MKSLSRALRSAGKGIAHRTREYSNEDGGIARQPQALLQEARATLERRGVTLLGGEDVLAVQADVQDLTAYTSPVQGSVFVTNYRFIFLPKDRISGITAYDVPFGNIQALVKPSHHFFTDLLSSESKNVVLITCRDPYELRLAFPVPTRSNPTPRRVVYYTLFRLLQWTSVTELFAFRHFAAGYDDTGWTLYDPHKEFGRFPVVSREWTFVPNVEYSLCPTYPRLLMLPAPVTMDDLGEIAGYVHENRIPTLSYLHENKAAVLRSAQPLKLWDCEADQRLYNTIFMMNPSRLPLYILEAQKSTAKSPFEMMGDKYANCVRRYLGVEGKGAVKESFRLLVALCMNAVDEAVGQEDEEKWLTKLDATGWLEHVRYVLKGALCASRLVDGGHSVVIRCRRGWDRTPLITSLVMLLLDPYYRTLRGMQILIEQEWIRFGHKFSVRSGIAPGDPKQRAPLFLLWLDCVWQLTRQFPMSFEFNERFLLTLLWHLFSCRFGTFLATCERERTTLELERQTVSLWSYMSQSSMRKQYTNPFYDIAASDRILKPSANRRALALWSGYFFRWNKKMKFAEEDIASKAVALIERVHALERAVE